jgi:transcriptional regulator with XRE-family HTH domain
MQIGRLVSGARASSGVPVRALASSAGVAGSTITRVQSGAVDPTVETLRRILDAAGFELRISAVRKGTMSRPSLASLTDAWTKRNDRLRPDWIRWRALIDELALHPQLVPEAIYPAPWPSGEPVVDALLAAVAEKLADDAGLPRPAWAEHTPQLDQPYEPPVARRVTGRHVPPQLAARALMIDTGSLWRDPETVGA